MTTMPAKEEKVDHAYYEELQAQLKEALSAKKAADKALSGVEDQIEKFEGVPVSCVQSNIRSKLSHRNKCKRERGKGIRKLFASASKTA